MQMRPVRYTARSCNRILKREGKGWNGPVLSGDWAGRQCSKCTLLDSEDQRNNAEVTALRTALELAAQAETSSGEAAELQAKVDSDPNDHQTRFDLALAYYAQGDNAQAIDELVIILRKNRSWNEEAAKEQLVKIFEALGDNHPDTVEGRQKMASVLFA